MPIVEANIRHDFGRFALDVKLASEGPVLGIFGPSGSGKSTVLNAIAGLFLPRAATISVRTRTVCRQPGGTVVPPERREIGYVTQDALLFPHLSVRGNLLFSPRSRGLETTEAKRVLAVLRLAPLLDRDTAGLSGGEKQRVALGRALLSQPQLLLLDEPLSALDAALAREAMALLLDVKRELRVPMVLVTHCASEMHALADDCVVLRGGKVSAQGAPRAVLTGPGTAGGLDNILRLPVARHEPEKGITWLDLGDGQVLACPQCRAQGPVAVAIHADEIILARSRPGGLSARNVLKAVVSAVQGSGPDTLVTLAVGPHSLLCHVTHAAADELGLEPGQEAFAVIKTSGCCVLGA